MHIDTVVKKPEPVQVTSFYIHDDLSVELITPAGHAYIPAPLLQEILDALDEETQTDDDEEKIQENTQEDSS